MSMASIFVGAVVSVLVVVGLLFTWYLLKNGFAVERAIEETMSGISGVILGVVSAGVLFASELLGLLVTVVTTIPGEIVSLTLGAVGYLSLDGVIGLQPETWGLITLALTAGMIALRDRRATGGS